MLIKSKLTKLVAIAALTIPLATPLAVTNKTLAMKEFKDTQKQIQTEEQAAKLQNDLERQLLEITEHQVTILDRILRFLGLEIQPHKEITVPSQEHKQQKLNQTR